MSYIFLGAAAVVAIILATRFSGLAEASVSAESPPPGDDNIGTEEDFNSPILGGFSFPQSIWPEPQPADVTPTPTTEPEKSSWDFGSLFSWMSSSSKANVADTPSNDLTGTRLPDWERKIIVETAKNFNIDARLLAALRQAENGGPGREFGILSVSAPSYQDQATVAARTISNNLSRYRAKTGQDPIGADGRVTRQFIEFFSNIYAPVGAGNDPTNLNQYHANNISGSYASINFA